MSAEKGPPVLTAVVTGRRVDLTSPGLPAVFICGAQETSAAIDPLWRAIRDRHPDPRSLLIATVIDLRKVPGLLRKVAEGLMTGNYNASVNSLAAGEDPAEHVVILPDWDGAALRALGFADVSRLLGVAVVAADGSVAGAVQEPEPLVAVLRLIDEATRSG
jgi:hypothetical protein